MLYFNIYVAVTYQWQAVVLFNDILRDDGNGEYHVFISSHWSSQVKIIEISHQVLGFRCSDGTFDDDLGGCGNGGWGADISRIVNQVATHC